MSGERVFVPLSLDKHDWHPSPLPGQIVFISTIDGDGQPNIAPKSWVSMAAFNRPVIGFGCNEGHRTAQNIRATGEFVVNIPETSLATDAWAMIATHGQERIDASGLTLIPSQRVASPRIAQCRSHLECRLHQMVEFDGGEVFIFGTIVAADIDVSCTSGPMEERYRTLDPAFFHEGSVYSGIGPIRHADAEHGDIPPPD